MSSSNLMEKTLFRFANQWIAGDTVSDALESAKDAYKKKMNALINKLGEYNTSNRIIQYTVDEYQTILSSLYDAGIEGGISVKPTQIGLAKSIKECVFNFEQIIDTASQTNAFVWIDMESSDHTDKTIEIYNRLFTRYERLGIVLQANLRRTRDDLEDLLQIGSKIRLVKGAYNEDKKISFRSKQDTDTSFERLSERLFDKANEFAIATHDPNMINHAVNLSKRNKRRFEFQMLKGINDSIKTQLVRDGFDVSEYIPYGTNWLPYSIRRLKERKRNLLLLGSSFIQSQRV